MNEAERARVLVSRFFFVGSSGLGLDLLRITVFFVSDSFEIHRPDTFQQFPSLVMGRIVLF